MKTPIYDFLKKYNTSGLARLHMPGHKGKEFLGCEPYDITEIHDADNLYNPNGIISQSEQNASAIFHSGDTFYSTEGSTLCIKSMIYAAYLCTDAERKSSPKIIAVRNVHKSFIYACATIGIEIVWIYPSNRTSLCSGTASFEEVKACLEKNKDAFAVYLTSPNYLGEITDIHSISKLCKQFKMPLLVDNAHGAYLKFADSHPLDLGADMCCDSAHKTLPVLTGGAYLHVAKSKTSIYSPLIKTAMTAFGSTSPSYLILASLDICNAYLNKNYSQKLQNTIAKIDDLKTKLIDLGYDILKTEPLKLTISTDGCCLSEKLRTDGIECEYSDKTALVMMFSPETTDNDFIKIFKSLSSAKPIKAKPCSFNIIPKKIKSVRDAFLAEYITVDIKNSLGKICASPCVSCPPAIPIIVSGEEITTDVINLLNFYNYNSIQILKD